MPSEQDVFACVLDILERLRIPYMIGGSIAAIAYGEPRLTLDMDVVVKLNQNQAKELSRSFGQEYYVDLESMLEAIRSEGHFNIINSEQGIKVDFYILKDNAFEQEEFSRRRKEAFDEKRSATFASPEDIILKKMEWHKMGESQKHLEDIKGILNIAKSRIDIPYIDKWALEIGVQDIWQRLKQNYK